MIKFALVGLAGFVAKKHVKCIKDLGGELIAAMDYHDNVGFIDSFFPNCIFFKKENEFFSFLKKKKINYVVVCSPSHLHFKHIKQSLIAKCNVIVEKPPILNSKNYLKILKLEKIYKKKCYCIFQLRLDKKLKNLKRKILYDTKMNNVEVIYYTFRGDWYFKSWKNIKLFSGGLLVNIAIHFFDILIWIFGNVKKNKILNQKNSEVRGYLELDKAKVKWIVSINKNKKKELKTRKKFYRIMRVNKKLINFDKFDDLHYENYKEIMKGNFHISNFENLIKFLPNLK